MSFFFVLETLFRLSFDLPFTARCNLTLKYVRDRAIGYVKGIYCEGSSVGLGDHSNTSVQIENSNVFSDYGPM